MKPGTDPLIHDIPNDYLIVMYKLNGPLSYNIDNNSVEIIGAYSSFITALKHHKMHNKKIPAGYRITLIGPCKAYA